MRRTLLLLALCAVTVSAQEPTFKRRFHSPPIPTGVVIPPPDPECTIDTPTNSSLYQTSTSAITIAGSCTDQDGNVVEVVVSCSTCTPTSVTDTTIVGNRYSASFTAQTEGPNAFTVVATDDDTNTSQPRVLLSTYTVAAAGDPVVTIQAPNGGANFNDTVSPVTVTGICADDVACTLVTWVNADTGGGGTCSGTSSWSCNVAVQSGSNAITVTGANQAGNTGTDTITGTIVFPLAWTTGANLGTYSTSSDTTRQLATSGGASPITFSEVAGSTLADDAHCAGITVNAAGLMTIQPTTAGSCTFTMRATDDDSTTADRAFTLTVVDTALEGPSDFWDDMNADPAFVRGFSLQSQSIINAQIHQWNASTPAYRMPWRYRYPSAASSDCFNNDCNDPLNPPQNAMKMEFQVQDCVDKTAPRRLVSITTETPSILRWRDDSGLSVGETYRVTIADATLPELNAEYFVRVTTKYPEVAPDGETEGEMYLDRARTQPFTASAAGAEAGLATFIQCDCQIEGTLACGGSDSPHLKPVFGTSHDARHPGSMLWTWDMWFGPTWSSLIKAFGAPFVNNATSFPSGGSFHLENVGSAITGSNGNGSPFDVAVVGLGTWRSSTPRPMGTIDNEPLFPGGEGSSGAGHRPWSQTNTFFHINNSVWTRFFLRISLDVPWNDDSFDAWRRHTGLTGYDAGFPITNCVVGATRTTFTADQFVFNNKWSRSFRVTISGHSVAALNGTYTALTVKNDADPVAEVTTFTIPNVSGAVCGTGGVMNPHWAHTSLWVADENRDATRIWFGLPAWDDTTSVVNLHWPFDTSDKAGTRREEMDGYARYVIALGDLDLDLSGSCPDNMPPTSGTGASTDRGWCTVDATNNPAYFRKPVRDP
jgi:hypothetical protein